MCWLEPVACCVSIALSISPEQAARMSLGCDLMYDLARRHIPPILALASEICPRSMEGYGVPRKLTGSYVKSTNISCTE